MNSNSKTRNKYAAVLLASTLGLFLGVMLGRRMAQTETIDYSAAPTSKTMYKRMTGSHYKGPLDSVGDLLEGPILHPYINNFSDQITL